MTLYFENGTTTARNIPLAASSRTNVAVADAFPQAAGRRFGVVVESVGADPVPIVVERSSYATGSGAFWHRGTNAPATRLR